MAINLNISLTDEEAAYVQDLVKHGRFPSINAALQDGLGKLRAALEPFDDMLRRIIQPRVTDAFVLLVKPSATAYGVERAEATTRDISNIGAYAFSNSMSFISANDESVHEEARSSRLAEVEESIMRFAGGDGEPWGWITPGLRRIVFERMLVYFTVDDERRMVRIMLLSPY